MRANGNFTSLAPTPNPKPNAHTPALAKQLSEVPYFAAHLQLGSQYLLQTSTPPLGFLQLTLL